MFVVSYCMIVSFNKQLSFTKIMIYKSFDQNPNEIKNISHFGNRSQPFFDLVVLNQLTDNCQSGSLQRKNYVSSRNVYYRVKIYC